MFFFSGRTIQFTLRADIFLIPGILCSWLRLLVALRVNVSPFFYLFIWY